MLADSALPLASRVAAAERLIAAHYAASVWASLDADEPLSFARHPGFAAYRQQFIHASQLALAGLVGDAVAAHLMAGTPRPAVMHVHPGTRCWH